MVQPDDAWVPAREPDAGAGRGLLRRPVAWAVVATGAAAVAYLGAALATAGRVPGGTSVAGLPIGGQGRQQAIQSLTAAQAKTAAVPVTVRGDQAVLDPAAAGLTVDPQAVVEDLTGFSVHPARLWRHVGGGPAVEAGSGSSDRLTAALRKVAEEADVPAADATVTLEGTTARITPSTAGASLDIPAAAGVLRRGWLAGSTPITLPVRSTPATIDDAQAQKALDTLVQPALAGPLLVKAGERTVSLPPEALAPSLRLVPGPEGLSLSVDGEELKKAVLKRDPSIETVPTDARIVLKNGRPAIQPDVPGQTLAADGLADAARAALVAPAGGERTVTAPTVPSPAKLTAEKAAALGVKEKVSTFSTNLTANRLRTENLTVAARTVNGTLVLPGKSFSLNGTLGRRTKAKGYHEAPAINGGRLVQDVGGGVSQMATTIFNNVFFAGLEDIYHKPHSFYISRYPEGREATVYWPTVDLKWRNDSPYAVLIQASVSGGQVHVSFWSTKVWEIKSQTGGRSNYRSPKTVYDPKPGCVSQDANSGFDVSVKRLFYRSGTLVKTQTWNTTYLAEDKVVCGPKPATPTP